MQSSAQHQSEYEKGKLVVWTGFSSCSATDKHLKRFTGDSGLSDAKFFVFLYDFSFFYPQVTYPKPERCFFQICTGQPYPDFLSLCQYTAPALGTAWSLFWRWQPALGETSMSFPATLAKKKFSCHPRSSVWGVFFFEKMRVGQVCKRGILFNILLTKSVGRIMWNFFFAFRGGSGLGIRFFLQAWLDWQCLNDFMSFVKQFDFCIPPLPSKKLVLKNVEPQKYRN